MNPEEIRQWDITPKYSFDYIQRARMQQMLVVVCHKCYGDYQFSASYLVEHIISLVKLNGWTLYNGKPLCLKCQHISNTDTLENEAVEA